MTQFALNLLRIDQFQGLRKCRSVDPFALAGRRTCRTAKDIKKVRWYVLVRKRDGTRSYGKLAGPAA